jgi:uncharacterized protein YjiS (DUF1127 family)
MSYEFDNLYSRRAFRDDPLGILAEARRQRALWLAKGVSVTGQALARLVRKASVWYRARRTRLGALAELRGLDDRMLKDIGLSRGDIEAAVAGELRHVESRPEAMNENPTSQPLTAANTNKSRHAA